MKKILVAIAGAASGLVLFAAPASAEPGHGSDCIMPSVNTCRLMPDASSPHVVQKFCPAQTGYVNVFDVCPSARFGPYSS